MSDVTRDLTEATTVHLGIVDASGTIREKRLGSAAAARAFRSGWSFIDAIDWWGPDDTVWRAGGSRSNRAVVDVESARPYPFGDDAAFFLADFAPPLRDLSPRARAQDLVTQELGLRSDLDIRRALERQVDAER